LVIVDKKLGFARKMGHHRCYKNKAAPAEYPQSCFLKSEEEVEESKDNVGAVTYYALKEGTEI